VHGSAERLDVYAGDPGSRARDRVRRLRHPVPVPGLALPRAPQAVPALRRCPV